MRYIQHPITLELIPADQYERPVQSGPMIMTDIKPYVSPVTLKRVDGRKQQRDDLARTGCRVADPSERQAFTATRPDRDVDL